MAELTLHGSPGAPWTRKVMVAMAEKGVAFRRPLRADGSASPAPAHLAPLGKTPVLILADGAPVFDSRAIIDWLEQAHPHPALLPVRPDLRAAARRWEALADGFADLGIARPVDAAQAQSLRSRAQGCIDAMEAGLDGRDWLIGDGLSIADVAVACVVIWHAARTSLEAPPRLRGLVGRMASRPSLVATETEATAGAARRLAAPAP